MTLNPSKRTFEKVSPSSALSSGDFTSALLSHPAPARRMWRNDRFRPKANHKVGRNVLFEARAAPETLH